MVSRQIQLLIQRSSSAAHLLQLHSLVLKTGLDHNPNFVSHYIYAACSISIDFSKLVFDHIPIKPPLFAWNSIIRAFTNSSNPLESLHFFFQLHRIGLKPDNFTYPFVLKACGRCSIVGVGGPVHSLILKVGFDSNRYIRNTLLRMYAACGAIGLARRVFDEMTVRDVVSWSSMIAGYVAWYAPSLFKFNCPLDAFKVFQDMKLANENPNSVTLVSLLSACTRLLNFRAGESIHCYIVVNCIGIDIALGTALLEMYSKCGHVEKAFQVFNSMSEKNLQSWTIMISGLADHGQGKDAISLFTRMEQTGLVPDSMSFSAILSACSHLGLVHKGRQFFNQMKLILIKNMPMEPNSVILRSFLGACRNHGVAIALDDKLRKLLISEPNLGANYVLAASVSSLSGCWNDAADIRVAMKQKGLVKVPGCSWVEVGGGGSTAATINEPLVVGDPTRKSSFVGAYENFPECQEQIETSQLNFFLDAAVNFS
ncbi:pentatricopeptide repeat-containing protein [Prunus yedoensis var. nudiflora]|uniref:Pentatricopeptide repeat-containing protein n=1 Tax=Prunus yedoensis var. nudiflora TaxID=2094558 RepID=A0A314Z368_PRUYE|nr:pentatricopeptide repeat-containing protein [Prunus yedoensis var. nudiflora]